MGSKSRAPQPPPRLRVPSARSLRSERADEWERGAVRARLSASLPSPPARLAVPLPGLALACALHRLPRDWPAAFLRQLGMLKRD